MATLIQYIYLYTFVVTCMSSENESAQPMSGFYTDGLDQALDKIEIVYPERVSKDGSFVSYYLPHYYNLESLENRPKRSDGSVDLSGDAIHFFVPIEGEKHHLELLPNLNFLAPGLVIERRDARDVNNINKAKISQISQKQCHYNGRIVGKPDSRAALSTCYGLAGYIQLPAGEEYLIEPVKDSKPAYNKEHPHIMYKRSGIKDRLGNSNCLTKGSAKSALDERLQWESIFGSQVRKDFSAVNMNDLVRENSVKVLKDTNTLESKDTPINTANNIMDTISSASLPQEKLVKSNENKFEEGNVNSINMKATENSIPLNGNYLNDGNVQPPSYPHFENNKFEKYEKSKIDFGNKLKQKPLKEELGSIKLPDVNISPLKSSPNQATYVDSFNNKHFVPSFEKEKKFYDGDFEPKRIKREINIGSKEGSEIKSVIDNQGSLNTMMKNDQNYNSGKGMYLADTNSLGELEKMPNVKRFSLEVNQNGQQPLLSKRQAQNVEEYSMAETKINGDIADKTNKEKLNNVNEDLIDTKDHNDKLKSNDGINGDISKGYNNFNTKQDANTVNKKESLGNNQRVSPQLTGIQNKKILNNENNFKRDIHLDTSEKSWQSSDLNGQLNSDEGQENTNSKDVDSAYSQNKLTDENLSVEKNLDSNLEGEFIKDNKSSKISKVKKINANDKDDVMVSALESVFQDMDKAKVKKDVLGGFAPSQSESVIQAQPPGFQSIYSKSPVKFDGTKYIRLDEVPMRSSADTGEREEITKTNKDGIKPSLGLINGGPTLDTINEPIQAVDIPNKNHVDEIVIKIKTPEGTVSEVKQNPRTEGENLRISNDEIVMNNENTGAKEPVFGLGSSQAQIKTYYNSIDTEKGKRGVDIKSQKEIDDKTISKAAQDGNIAIESTHKNYGETISDTNNKVKRDDNTIHLVIETEPEVKSSENQNAESLGSNLFCQGRNCLEIKPIYLTDTKSAVNSSTSNVNNVDSSKQKVVEKRDAKDAVLDECDVTSTPPPMKCHDFNNRIFTLEVMLTIDFKVVQMHEDDDIENFILTVINMVSSNFDDKSLGININVVLVRLILLTTCIKELDSDRFNPEELLENFCTWQLLVNPGRDDHPHHHDLAIYVSKMDKCEGKVMGVSYLTSVCRPDKACIICVDEGLLLANTITHQIGHSLGAEHDDGQHSACAPRLPDGTTYHMAPTISETSNSWSVCSRDAIFQFVQTQGSWCLLDFPVVRSYNFPLMLPGQIYSAAQQCRLNFHMTAIPCSVGPFCNKLYCQITDKLCATKGDPPADGTFCASNMWCFHKQCVHVGRRPGAINGEWGPWTEWSLCTRSCGGGVSSSYRICNNPKPENGGRFCIGERLRHRICQTTPCQGFTESFRDLQCKRTEDRPFRGKIHNWVQYQSLFINIECALVCQNRKGDVVMRSPIVADGTPCKAGTQNVCIQGLCRSVGCDYVIDSNAKEDACGICHGNGTECKIIQGVFEEAIAKKGLVEFLRIPKESGMIFVREVSPSTNTIVVSGSINRVFYLNGLGAEDSMAGDVAFGVTHGVYEKRGGMERIFIRGPTKEDLIFYMYFRDRNRGIHYQYAMLDYDPTYIPQYVWQYLDWDACSDPCSGGSQRARAKCVEDRGGVVDDKYCTQSTRPIDIIRPCNDFPCQAKWWVSVWSDCICTGATSVMFRSVLCMRANDESGTRVEVVKESECLFVKKPPTQKPCNYSDEDNDCAKRSIPDDAMFRARRDLRRAVHPRLAFSEFSPEASEGNVLQEVHLSPDQPLEDTNKESFHDLRFIKKSKVQNKSTNNKGTAVRASKSKTDGKGLIAKKKDSSESLKDTGNLKSVDLSQKEIKEGEPEAKSDVLPLTQSKGRQVANIIQKDNEGIENSLTPGIANNPAADEDMMMKDNDVMSVACESTEEPSTCPTEEDTSETPTTCKNTCAPQPHKKTTCCKTTPHRQYVIKTTMETTTIRPVAVKMDELNVNNFALTVVPLEFANKKKLLPQSDPEFINLGAVGQFGVADEFNATVITGQEALDLLEFARSNASEEPVILHEDMHN